MDEAALLGLELDTRYRVLAATVEPPVDDAEPSTSDGRIQIALYPCSVFETRLVRSVPDDAAVLERFSLEQLLDVVVALDAPRLYDIEFDGPSPSWREVSLEGRSQAADGHRHRLSFAASRETRTLEVHATFDEVRIGAARGTDDELEN